MIRIFVADDHPVVRQGIRRMLEQHADLVVAGEAADGWQVLHAEDRATWDVLVLDLSLPKIGGLEVFRRLRAELPALRILVLSMYPEEQYAPRLLLEGAAGYLSKDRDPDEVLAAIRAVAAGGSAFSADVLERARSPHAAKPHERLSAREYQIFTLVVQGRTVSEIAAELAISASTVSNHLMKVREKLGVGSIAEIVRYAHGAGLL